MGKAVMSDRIARRHALLLRITLAVHLGLAWLMAWSMVPHGTRIIDKSFWFLFGASIGLFAAIAMTMVAEYSMHLSGKDTFLYLFRGGRNAPFPDEPHREWYILSCLGMLGVSACVGSDWMSNALLSAAFGLWSSFKLTVPESPLARIRNTGSGTHTTPYKL